jgi:hypothetical protein
VFSTGILCVGYGGNVEWFCPEIIGTVLGGYWGSTDEADKAMW